MTNAQIARAQLQQAQQRITSQRQQLEEQRRQVERARVPALTREQLGKQTPISAAKYRGQVKQQAQQRTKALEQIKKATGEISRYESSVILPFQTKVVAAEKIMAEQKAFEGASKMYAKRVPYQFTSGLEKKYLKKMYSSAKAAKEVYSQKIQAFQKEHPGERLIFEGGELKGIQSEALGMTVLPEHYGDVLARVQAPQFDAQFTDLPAVQQLGITTPSLTPPPSPEFGTVTAAPERTVLSKIYGTAAHYLGVAGQRAEEMIVEPVKEFARDVPEFVTERVVPSIVEFAKPKIEYVAEQPIISTALDMPAFTPGISAGPLDVLPIVDKRVTVGQVIATEPKIRRFLTQAAVKGAEISYEETFGRLPPESRPGRLISTFEEYSQIMEDVKTGKVKREDVDWSQYIIPYTPEEFGKVVGFGATVAPYVAAEAIAPGVGSKILLAGDVILAREDYQNALEIAEKTGKKYYKDYLKTSLEEGEEHLPEKEYLDIVVPQLETELKNQALVAMGVSGGFLAIGALWKVGKTLKKFIPSKKFTFEGTKMSQAKYDKLMKAQADAKLSALKEQQLFAKEISKTPPGPKAEIEFFGKGGSRDVITRVEQIQKVQIADDLFNHGIFKTQKEVRKFIESGTITKSTITPPTKTTLWYKPKVEVAGADIGRPVIGSYTMSGAVKRDGITKIVQVSFQSGARGQAINLKYQIVNIPKNSKYGEVLFYNKGQKGYFNLVDKYVADFGKIKVAKIDERFIKLYHPKFRKVDFTKTRVKGTELLDDVITPTKEKLKSLYGKGTKVEEHVILEGITPRAIDPRLSLVARRDLFGVRAEVIKPYDIEIRGWGIKEGELIKPSKWLKDVSKKPISPKTPFKDYYGSDVSVQFLTARQITKLDIQPSTLIPTPPVKITVPKIKVTPPAPILGEGLPYMVGGTGLAISDISTLGVGVKVPTEVIDKVDLAPDKVLDIDLLPVKVGVTDWGAGLARDRIDITPRVISVIKPALEIKPVTKLEPLTKMFQPTVIKPISRVVQVPRAVQVPRLKVAQVLKVAPSVAVTPAIIPRITPRPIKPMKPIYIPKLKVPSMKRRPPKKKLPPEVGYGIEIRRKGKWEKAKIPYAFATEEGAHAVGMEKTVKEAAASYRLVPSKKPVKRTRKKPSALHKVMFRPGKEKGVMVQKKLLRITTPGEIRQISLKGAAARRGVSTWGIKKPKKKPTKKKSAKKKGGKK